MYLLAPFLNPRTRGNSFFNHDFYDALFPPFLCFVLPTTTFVSPRWRTGKGEARYICFCGVNSSPQGKPVYNGILPVPDARRAFLKAEGKYYYHCYHDNHYYYVIIVEQLFWPSSSFSPPTVLGGLIRGPVLPPSGILRNQAYGPRLRPDICLVVVTHTGGGGPND